MSRNMKRTRGRVGRGVALGAAVLAAAAAGASAQTWSAASQTSQRIYVPYAAVAYGYGIRGYFPATYAAGSYFAGNNRYPGGSFFPGYGYSVGGNYRPPAVVVPPYGMVSIGASALGPVYGLSPYNATIIGGRWYPQPSAYTEYALREQAAFRNALLYGRATGYTQRAWEAQLAPVTFRIEPPDAVVYLNGVYVGTAGALNAAGSDLRLLAGKYTLEVGASGHIPVTAEAEVRPGQPVTLQHTLEPQPATPQPAIPHPDE